MRLNKKNISDISNIINKSNNSNRYVLVSYLTNKTDYGNQGTWQDCSTYGYAVGLTLEIIDSKTNTLVWDGHLDKQNKVNACADNNDFELYPQQQHDEDNDINEAKTFLAIAFITVAINAIVDNGNNTSLANNDFNAIFSQTVDSLAQRLPSFYH